MIQHAEHVESVLGIPVFTWKGWDELDEQVLVFHNVRFLLDSLRKYDGCDIAIDFGWNFLEVFKEDKTSVKIDLFDVPEFVEALNKRIKTHNCC